MTIYSSSLTWDIPQTEEAGRLQYMGLQKVGYDLEAKPPPQLNTKEDLRVGRVEAVLGGNQSKHNKGGYGFYADLNQLLSSLIRFFSVKSSFCSGS